MYKTGGSGEEVGKFYSPYLSDVDSEGKLLVCDNGNNRCQVFDTQNKVWSELSELEGVEGPTSAGLGDKLLWVGTELDNELHKFEVI